MALDLLAIYQRVTDNTMAERRRTKQIKSHISKSDRQYNG
jgi:hypothetical protein